MSRLLFAAARGARIQSFKMSQYTRVYKVDNGVQSKLYWKLASDEGCYIHPDDAHLQYGPISTALREYAETGDFPHTLTGLMARAAINHAVEHGVVWADDHATFCLIMAEFLADEGL